jgi:thymidylate synthase
MLNVNEIREYFRIALAEKDFVIDKTGSKMLELVGASFVASEPSIFGVINEDYVKRELDWYKSCSLNVNTIAGDVPKIWKQVATPDGRINSNYGWCVFHPDNGMQYDRVKEELIGNPWSRRAIMIYTRPTMHMEYNTDGMSDFMCTNAVQYMIRNGKLTSVVQMRSNDVVFGYKNDYAWQKYVLDKLAADLEVPAGDIIWNAGSLHVYERHFLLVK